MSDEPEEVALARVCAGHAEAARRRGDWDRATTEASMATMYLTIAMYKRSSRSQPESG